MADVNRDHLEVVTGLLVTHTPVPWSSLGFCNLNKSCPNTTRILIPSPASRGVYFGFINSTAGFVDEAGAFPALTSSSHTLCKAGSAQLCCAHGGDHPAHGSHWAPPQPGPGKDLGISVYDQHWEPQWLMTLSTSKAMGSESHTLSPCLQLGVQAEITKSVWHLFWCPNVKHFSMKLQIGYVFRKGIYGHLCFNAVFSQQQVPVLPPTSVPFLCAIQLQFLLLTLLLNLS